MVSRRPAEIRGMSGAKKEIKELGGRLLGGLEDNPAIPRDHR